MLRSLRSRALCALLLAPALVAGQFAAPLAALAQAQSFITGTVVADGKPVAQTAVTLSGNNLTLHATTNAAGSFTFSGLTVGQYLVGVQSVDGRAVETPVTLTSGGATLRIDAGAAAEIGRIVVQSPQAAVNHASGTDFVVNAEQISRAAYPLSFPNILLQAPTAARGSNGQIHLNGDHNGLNYVIDGVQVPEGLNRVLGNEIDPGSIGFMEILEGAYPAQFGDKFAGVVNITTRAQSGPAGGSVQIDGGAYNTYQALANYHMPVGNGGGLSFGGRVAQTSWALDPPVPNPVHDNGSTAAQYLRLNLPLRGTDTLNFSVAHSYQTFQIPPDTNSGVPANTADNEYQDDTLASLIYSHAFSDNASITFGPSYKRSRILDTNDLQNDLAGQIMGPQAGPCVDFSDCGFLSVYADRTDINARFNVDFLARLGSHTIRAGGFYGAETLTKNYVMTVGATPDGVTLAPFTVVDNAPNVSHQQELFIQDSWQIDPHWSLDYGVRSDSFQVFSTDFNNGFAQFSPRAKLTYSFNNRANVYAYYGRLFVPFSLESVSSSAAAALYTTPVTVSGNDLKPQRDSLYELGGHLPLGAGELGIRLSHKVSTDWIDDTQVGATNLHQDINFPQGRADSQTLYYTLPLPRNGRFYVSVSHVTAVNSLNCETQLLQNCAAAGPPGGPFAQADHDQHYDVPVGFLWNDRHGGWFAFNAEYGSGLSQDPTLCSPYDGVGNLLNCKVPPHFTVDLAKGIPLARGVQMALTVQNLFNDRYAITLDNTLQGTHYVKPQSFGIRFLFGGASTGR